MIQQKQSSNSSKSAQYGWLLLGLVSISFHLWLIFSGLVSNLISRPLHMALALPWVFIFLAKSELSRKVGYVFTLIGLSACFYIAFNEELLSDQYGSLEGPLQLWLAGGLIITVLEMARRAIGWPLPTIATLALLYGLFGEHLLGEFGHPGLPLESFLGTMTVAESGLWGSLTGVSVNIVAIFVIMGAVLNAGEAGQGFMNLAASAAGRLKGGAAKVSVLSSALFGSISGSASANVASTGSITLPAMKKLGYPLHLAGAVEAVASSGGQIMPPLMGAGAFVMVELTGVPYTQIMGAALLPAILYFLTVWIGINAYAGRYDLNPIEDDQLPDKRTVLITASFFAVPFITLLSLMFMGGYTPQYAAAGAILAGFLLLFFDSKLSLDNKRSIQRIKNMALAAGQQIAVIASIILCAGLIISVLGQTGLGVKITSLILSVGGEQIWPALLLTALACLILGMEVPTTAAYVICISVAGPALEKLGLQPLIAHLFVFWFALLSTITPPVCGAVFIAAGMIGENWLKIALTAMALGVGLYIIPLGMIANPAIISLAETPIVALLVFIKFAIGLGAVSYGLIGKQKLVIKLLLVVGGLLLVFL